METAINIQVGQPEILTSLLYTPFCRLFLFARTKGNEKAYVRTAGGGAGSGRYYLVI